MEVGGWSQDPQEEVVPRMETFKKKIVPKMWIFSFPDLVINVTVERPYWSGVGGKGQ